MSLNQHTIDQLADRIADRLVAKIDERNPMGLEAILITGLIARVNQLESQLAAAQAPVANLKDPADLAAETQAEQLLGLDSSGNPLPAAAPTSTADAENAQPPAPVSEAQAPPTSS